MLIAGNPNLEKQNPSASGPESVVARRMQIIRTMTLTISILTGLASVGLLVLWLQQNDWQIALLAALFAATTLTCAAALRFFYPRASIYIGLGSVSLALGITVIASSAFLKDLGISAAIIFLVYTLIISSITLTDRQANLAIGNGIIVAGTSALFNDFSPFVQLSNNIIQIVAPAILVVLFIVYVVMLATQFVAATLRIRLVTAFLAIVLIPLAILSYIQSQYMFSVLNREINQGLELAAQQTALGIDNFISETNKSVQEIAQMDVLSRYLELPQDERQGSTAEQEMRMALQVLDTSSLNNTIYLSSYGLIDMEGVNLYDTLSDRLKDRLSPDVVREMGLDVDALLQGSGAFEGDQDYFLVPARSGTSYISPVHVNNSTKGFFYISAPVKNKKGQLIGVLRARYDGLLLQDLLKQYNGLLGPKTYAILLDENNIRLADAFTPNYIYKAIAPLSEDKVRVLKANRRLPELPTNMLWTNYEEFEQILNNFESNKFFQTELSLAYGDTEHTEIGAVIKLRSMPWKIVYLETDYSDEAVRLEQRRRTNLATTLIACLVGVVAVVAAHFLSQPINRLTKTAQRISEGDLEAQAPMHNTDEFGMLGRSFNMMTSQLRGLIGQLEERVQIRTKEIENQNLALSHRATQLQTVSEVARQIVSSQELETLLSTISQLISERFGFYHVGIFLLDENREFAVLRAANSEGGHRMLARNHKLQAGKVGMVGYVTGTGEPRIATDVGEDAVFFNNPDLPNTRSEMTLPLRAGDQIIGALDIQSTESNAFRPEDIELFATMADQVAIAIYNNQLYLETRRALDEAQQLHRQYLRSEWAGDTARRKVLGYVYNNSGVTPQVAENPLWKEVFETGEPVFTLPQENGGMVEKSMMAMPIAIRGETIGVIHVQDQGETRDWSEDEIAVINSIANQVAVALENARLFETTARRAEREKKALEITAKIRSTNDPDEMMRIAVGELQKALHASRTQIYIRQSGETNEKETPGSNGHKSPSSRDIGRREGAA